MRGSSARAGLIAMLGMVAMAIAWIPSPSYAGGRSSVHGSRPSSRHSVSTTDRLLTRHRCYASKRCRDVKLRRSLSEDSDSESESEAKASKAREPEGGLLVGRRQKRGDKH